MTVATQRPATMTARPSIAASLLAIGAGTSVAVLLGVEPIPVLLVALAGIGLVAGGLALRRRDYGIAGSAVTLLGAGASVVAVALAAASAGDTSELLWAVPGVAGIVLLGLAVAPVRGSGTRWLVKAGAGAVFLSVALAGLFRVAPPGTLLLAMVATVLSWDAGEHAIDVGRQLGRNASTWRLDVAHVGATAAVGVVGVLAGHAIAGMQAGELSLAAFALLGLALLALTLALHR